MRPTFVFQKTSIEALGEYGPGLEQACADLNVEFLPITIRPFEHTVVEGLPSHLHDVYVIAHGSNVMEEVVKTHGWAPGWFDIDHDEQTTLEKYGEHYINSDMKIYTTENYSEIDIEDEFFFIKPKDQKYFPGTITDRKMLPFVVESQGRHFNTPEVYDLCVSPIKHIEGEWRFFFVNDQLVDGSKYHAENLRLDVQPGFPGEVGHFAEQMIKIHSPGYGFTIDIARMQNGEMKIVEVNCLNSSGLYAIDKHKFIESITK